MGEVGRGGTSIAYKARDTDLDELVVLKELTGAAARDAVTRERFVRSARLATTFEHPNVVGVRDVFVWEGAPYVAMEYAERGSVRPWLRNLTPTQFAGVFEGVLAGLGYVAGRGIVHRDLKPENLLVSGSGRVKVADFALAKSVRENRDPEALTPIGSAVGTPSYMAPEQALGGEVGPWTDLYALGCIAYEVLVGNVPFGNRESPMSMLGERVSHPVPAAVSLVPFVLRDFSDWVSRLLAIDPADRPDSPESAWRELEAIIVELEGARWRDSADLPSLPATPHLPDGFETYRECPTCGELTSLHKDFCSHCGTYLRWEPTEEGVAVPPPGPSRAGEPPPDEHTGSFAPVSPPSPPAAAAPDLMPPQSAGRAKPRWKWRWRLRPEPDHASRRDEPASVSAAPGDGRDVAPPVPSAPPDVSDPSPETFLVRRTPHLDISSTAPLNVGGVFEVSVYADDLPARTGEEVEDIRVEAPRMTDDLVFDVWLVATHHFLITDAPIRSIRLAASAPHSDRASFRVAVVAAALEPEQPLITASFSFNGRPSGRVTRAIQIAAAYDASQATLPATEPTVTPAVEVDVTTTAPDLTIEVAAPENDDRRFEVRVETPLLELDRRTETWYLPAEASELVMSAMARFFDPDATSRARMSSLRGAGLDFFDAAPQLVKDVYWQLADQGHRPRNVFIVSDERSIPWELMIPTRRTSEGLPEEHEPLGVQMAIGRWHRQSCVSPRQRVTLSNSIVVAPHYAASVRLEHAAAEAEYVCRNFAGSSVEPASFDNLDTELERAGADLLHFICHGEADDREQILLLEEPDKLYARQIRAMPGLVKACRERKPFVFLNACELGRQGRGLSAASGFAKSFIDSDATCVVGTLWSVDDETAHAAAIEFYDSVLREPHTPFAEILRRIRARGYENPGQDSWAAYCFYGDPAARFE